MRRHPRSRKVRQTRRASLGWIRLLSAFLFAFFVAQSSVAYALAALDLEGCADCCGDGDSTSDDEKPLCPCPNKCAEGCAGNCFRALAPVQPELDPPFPLPVELADALLPDEAPASPDPLGIVHVPKAGRA